MFVSTWSQITVTDWSQVTVTDWSQVTVTGGRVVFTEKSLTRFLLLPQLLQHYLFLLVLSAAAHEHLHF
ncbi:hypothetical protein LJC08_03530 [Methanimicrococcus sp. OttesenSCG-928-J09]|nr:hypothetical protein [Methanimicrococcus sp. OttesenSCG-928-J09]